MAQGTEGLWTIEALEAAVAQALSVQYDGQSNGQVREVPDRRTIRYYTTLGLLDRPAEMRGRTALYGKRHLLQLVAIKRLQSEGRTLSEIQSELIGRSAADLRKLAQLPKSEELEAEAPPRIEARRRAFWGEVPPEAEPSAAEIAAEETAGVLTGAPIGGGAHLMFEAARALGPEDLEALRKAARPLFQMLIQRGLLKPERK